ncbi:hypothetical protein DFR42_11620 [Undibacterium pigrum]|uniref:Peptidase C14 caspase domain-containing protein n=2 Tax=Undibacterium pigrum TaxID=401470 RepID=A0A318IMU4_9BURK|nr:hypothetical protein DFR42_11620 [Undibacterium pigrum]
MHAALLSASYFFLNRTFMQSIGAALLKASQSLVHRKHVGVKRVALFIVGPGPVNELGDAYLPGVQRDLDAYRTFFESPLGGAWESYEILTLKSPSKYSVKAHLKLASKADYAFIAFIGNEVRPSKQDTKLITINNKETMLDREFMEDGGRRTIIFDCNRKTAPAQAMEKAVFADSPLPDFDRTNCRKYFDRSLMKCSPVVVVAHACRDGEYANDDHSYISQQIRQANNYALNLKYETCDSYYTLRIAQVHARASAAVRAHSKGLQNPALERARPEDSFPFCILAWSFVKD